MQSHFACTSDILHQTSNINSGPFHCRRLESDRCQLGVLRWQKASWLSLSSDRHSG